MRDPQDAADQHTKLLQAATALADALLKATSGIDGLDDVAAAKLCNDILYKRTLFRFRIAW